MSSTDSKISSQTSPNYSLDSSDGDPALARWLRPRGQKTKGPPLIPLTQANPGSKSRHPSCGWEWTRAVPCEDTYHAYRFTMNFEEQTEGQVTVCQECQVDDRRSRRWPRRLRKRRRSHELDSWPHGTAGRTRESCGARPLTGFAGDSRTNDWTRPRMTRRVECVRRADTCVHLPHHGKPSPRRHRLSRLAAWEEVKLAASRNRGTGRARRSGTPRRGSDGRTGAGG